MSFAFLPYYQWAAALAISLVLWCWYYVRPSFGLLPASLLGFLSLSSIYTWVWVENRYVTLNFYDQTSLRFFSCDSLAKALLILVPMMYAAKDRWHFRFLGEIAAGSFVFINSLWVLWTLITTECVGENACGGAGNPSIMLSLTVCMLPIVIKSWRHQWWLVLIASMATVASRSTVAMSLLALYFAYSMIASRRFWLAALLSPLPVLLGVTLWKTGKPFFHTGNRLMIWKYIMPMWAKAPNIPFGMGWGTFHVFSINMQNYNNKHIDVAAGSYWDTLHNEWLQMLFEGGAAALVLMIGTYLAALYRMFKSRELDVATSIVFYGLFMAVNPALHHAIPSVFGAWLFVYALKKSRHHSTWPLYSKQGDFYV